MRYLNKILLACMALANVNCENTWKISDVDPVTGSVFLLASVPYNSFLDDPETKSDTTWIYSKGKTTIYFKLKNLQMRGSLYSNRSIKFNIKDSNINTNLDEYGAKSIAADIITIFTHYCRDPKRTKAMIEGIIDALSQYANLNPEKKPAVGLLVSSISNNATSTAAPADSADKATKRLVDLSMFGFKSEPEPESTPVMARAGTR